MCSKLQEILVVHLWYQVPITRNTLMLSLDFSCIEAVFAGNVQFEFLTYLVEAYFILKKGIGRGIERGNALSIILIHFMT